MRGRRAGVMFKRAEKIGKTLYRLIIYRMLNDPGGGDSTVYTICTNERVMLSHEERIL